MILYKTDMTVNVTPFSDEFGMMTEVPAFHTAVSYDCPIQPQYTNATNPDLQQLNQRS